MEKKLKSRIVGSLRKLWLYSSERNNVIKSALVERGRFKCNLCGGIFKRNEIQVDHLKMISKMDIWCWNKYIDNLFNSEQQVLCKLCHKQKTKNEKNHL
jgi:5-methylcytosine-specific restriction endonuclease McrA